MFKKIHQAKCSVKHFARVVWDKMVLESSMKGRLRVASSQRHRRLHRSGNLRRTGLITKERYIVAAGVVVE